MKHFFPSLTPKGRIFFGLVALAVLGLVALVLWLHYDLNGSAQHAIWMLASGYSVMAGICLLVAYSALGPIFAEDLLRLDLAALISGELTPTGRRVSLLLMPIMIVMPLSFVVLTWGLDRRGVKITEAA